jgi:hypothetical protein
MWITKAKYNELVRESKELRSEVKDLKEKRRRGLLNGQIQQLFLTGLQSYIDDFSNRNLQYTLNEQQTQVTEIRMGNFKFGQEGA